MLPSPKALDSHSLPRVDDIRAGTRNEANRPSLVKDPLAHESFERALADPSLPARIYPELFSR